MTLNLPDKYGSGLFENESDRQIYLASSSLLKELGISPNENAYYFILEAAAVMIKKARNRLYAFEMFSNIGHYYGKTSSTVERSIKKAIDKAWKAENPGIRKMFERSLKDGNGSPTAMQFLKVFVDCIMTEDKRPEEDNDFIRIAFGNMLLNLDKNKYRLKDINVALRTIDGKIKEYNYDTARNTFPEFEAGFVQLIIDGIAIPRQYEELNVSDLNYSDNELGKKIVDELSIDGIHFIKDFRKHGVYDLRKCDFLDKKYIDEFDEALMRTIINALQVRFQPTSCVAINS